MIEDDERSMAVHGQLGMLYFRGQSVVHLTDAEVIHWNIRRDRTAQSEIRGRFVGWCCTP